MTTETDAGNPAGSAAPEGSATAGNSAAPDMDATLRGEYQRLMAGAEGGEDATATATATATGDDADDGTDAQTTAGRVRGPDGKFVKAGGETDDETQQTATEQTTSQQAKPHDAAPNTWRKELGAEYAKLSENVRQEIHRRENDFHKGIGQYKEAAGFGQQIAQELLPYQQQMQQANLHPREVVKQLAGAWNTLSNGSPQEKANLVLQLVKDYGIDFSSLGTDPQQETAQHQDDPRLATALQRLEKLEGTLTAQERQRAEAEYASNVDLVEKFMADPVNEHAQAVRGEMAALLRSGQASDLKDAYDKAIWINPEVRGLLLAKQEKDRADKAAKEAAAARKAAGANVTRRGTPPVPQKTGTMDDTIKSRYRELTGS